ncbi:MAG: O-antigen ligase family protein [Mariniblastus sp.]
MAFVFAILLALAVFAAPWPIGGNWAFTRLALLLVTFSGLIGAVLCQFKSSQSHDTRRTVVWMLLLIGIAFTYFQSSDLSSSVQARFGKENSAVNISKRMDDTSDATATSNTSDGLAQRPVSVYPGATREKLVDLILGVGLFFAASVLLIERKSILAILISLASVGVAISFFGVIQNLSWNGKLFWSYELLSGGGPFGSFVNKNNAAGFMLISFSATIFFIANQLLIWNRRQEPGGLVLSSVDWESEQRESESWIKRFMSMVALVEPKHLYIGAGVAIIFAGVFASLSRGGMVALAGATIVAIISVGNINRKLAAVLAIALIGSGVAFLKYSEQDVGISDSLESLADISNAAAPRLAHWQDAWPFAMENLALGSGNGTYRYVSPSFQSFFFPRTYAHAESIYLETIVEMGVGGVLLLLLVIGVCFSGSLRLLTRRETFDRALGVTGLTCLTGQVISSAFDFGMYQPANTVAMAVLMGAVVGRASQPETRNKPNTVMSARVVILGGLMLMLFCTGWASYNSYGIESRKSATRAIKFLNRNRQKDVSVGRNSLDEIEAQLTTAIEIVPDDFKAHFQLGELYVAKYRVIQAKKVTESLKEELKALKESGASQEQLASLDMLSSIDAPAVWASTSISALHREVRFRDRNNPTLAEEIRNDEGVQEFLKPAWESFLKAESICPRVGHTKFRLAQLSALFDPDLEIESKYLVSALSRSHSSTQLRFDCGLLALSSGDQELAVELWAKCLSTPHLNAQEKVIVELSKTELPMKLLFERVLPQNPLNLLRVARKYFREPRLELPKRMLLVHTRRVIDKNTELSDADRFFFLGETDRLVDQFEAAAENYKKALDADPARIAWRFEYAKCLHQIGNFDEAVRQLKICELEPSKIHSFIKPLLDRIRKDRANATEKVRF